MDCAARRVHIMDTVSFTACSSVQCAESRRRRVGASRIAAAGTLPDARSGHTSTLHSVHCTHCIHFARCSHCIHFARCTHFANAHCIYCINCPHCCSGHTSTLHALHTLCTLPTQHTLAGVANWQSKHWPVSHPCTRAAHWPKFSTLTKCLRQRAHCSSLAQSRRSSSLGCWQRAHLHNRGSRSTLGFTAHCTTALAALHHSSRSTQQHACTIAAHFYHSSTLQQPCTQGGQNRRMQPSLRPSAHKYKKFHSS